MRTMHYASFSTQFMACLGHDAPSLLVPLVLGAPATAVTAWRLPGVYAGSALDALKRAKQTSTAALALLDLGGRPPPLLRMIIIWPGYMGM